MLFFVSLIVRIVNFCCTKGYGAQSAEEKQRLFKLMRHLNLNGEYGSEPYTPTAQNSVALFLSWDPCKRPTALEVLQHPFFQSCYYVPPILQ
ncbi:cyclin-dependent kinase F-4-like isoform X2 [Daucus carota subsp. sativus]|uniref:cyclin-dependent kinase F-4-like isoform X2 n=1 Tax=Daucus carota subsp. sativus TaxID=79200 RepID=UPI003083EBCA